MRQFSTRAKGSSIAVMIGALILSLSACSGEPARDRSPTKPVDRTATIDPRPVMVGFNGPRFDACPSFGRVTNLNPQGDNFLSVREAPATSAKEIDQLTSGSEVAMCQDVGGWIGIVYAPAGEELDCGTGSPVAEFREYSGPCRSGWVSEDYIKLVAG